MSLQRDNPVTLGRERICPRMKLMERKEGQRDREGDSTRLGSEEGRKSLELFGSRSAKVQPFDFLSYLSQCFFTLRGSGWSFCYLKPRVLTSTFGKSSVGNDDSRNECVKKNVQTLQVWSLSYPSKMWHSSCGYSRCPQGKT